MNKLILILYFTIGVNFVFGETCIYNDISNKYNFKVEIKRIHLDDISDSAVITITINGKQNKSVQIIKFSSIDLFSNVFIQCDFVRSYTTGKNKDAKIEDNNYGDLIIADLNFDGKEDFAVKKDSGGNSGPFYNFYIQRDGKFLLDHYLTETVGFFPESINKDQRKLITLVYANVHDFSETTFQLDTKTNKWKKIKHRYLPY